MKREDVAVTLGELSPCWFQPTSYQITELKSPMSSMDGLGTPVVDLDTGEMCELARGPPERELVLSPDLETGY